MSIRTSDKTDLFYPAFHAARSAIRPAGKSGENKFDHYDYATENDWHAAVMPALLANGLTISSSVTCVTNLDDRATKAGGAEHVCQVSMTARLTHVSGQWQEGDVAGQGQDRADKAVYKAQTGCRKYLYANLLMLPTSDDPEGDESVGQASAPKAAPPPKKATQNPPPKPPPPKSATWKECATPTERSAYIEGALSRAKGDAANLNTVGEFLQAHASGFDPARFAELCKLAAGMLSEASQKPEEVLL